VSDLKIVLYIVTLNISQEVLFGQNFIGIFNFSLKYFVVN